VSTTWISPPLGVTRYRSASRSPSPTGTTRPWCDRSRR
jgi:hypothetical protein